VTGAGHLSRLSCHDSSPSEQTHLTLHRFPYSPLIIAIVTMSQKRRPRRTDAQRREALAHIRKVARQVWVRFQIEELLREIDAEDDHDRRD
jgi:hypothetical protein